MARKRHVRPLLCAGDTVGVVAPGFAVRDRLLGAGVARLERLGYRVALGAHVRSREGYFAGTDAWRARDLADMLRDPEIDAVWFARGGYGTARLLDRVPWPALRRRPKPLIGYSDLTALFAPVVERSEAVCLYGPVVTELGDARRWHAPSLRGLLAGRPLRLPVRRADVIAPGRARGRLVGGNLSVLTHLCGTRYQPDCRGAILFLEEVGEETYRIDRMLTQLRQSGMLRDVRGVVLGSITAPARRRFPPDRDLDVVLEEAFAGLGVPVVRNVPAGHRNGKRTLPLGGETRLDTRRGELLFTP